MISTYIPSVTSSNTLLFQMVCLAVFVGIIFFSRIRLHSIYMVILGTVVLIPYVSFMRLNPDSYTYFAMSTHYLENDILTVGQLVPGLIAVLRILFGTADMDDPQFISESLQVLFYLLIILFLVLSWASMKKSNAHRSSLGVCLGGGSLLVILTSTGWYHMDFHSYNGEIVAVVLLAISTLFAFRSVSVTGILVRALLAGSMAYVKAQVLPAVLFFLLIRNRKLTIKGFRINERILLLTVAACMFLLFESGIILFSGHPSFLSKIPPLFRYMYMVKSPAPHTSPDFALFLSQNAPKKVPLQTLLWALEKLITLTPGIFVSLAAFVVFTVISRRFRFCGKSYLKIAVCYMFVALLSITLPGNKFPHYLLLSFPVMGILARGFSVAGARLNLKKSSGVLAAFLLLLLPAEIGLVKNYYLFKGLYAPINKYTKITEMDLMRELPYDLIQFLRQNTNAEQNFFVHGYDFELYAYTHSKIPSYNLGFMLYKTRRLEDFCNYALGLNKLAPMFIVDAVAGNWGYVKQRGLALKANPSFKALILNNYRRKGWYSNIPVYERVGNAPVNTAGTACAK